MPGPAGLEEHGRDSVLVCGGPSGFVVMGEQCSGAGCWDVRESNTIHVVGVDIVR